MKDRNVISWAVVSLIGFLVINLLMTRPFVQITGATGAVGSDFWKTTIIAVILYAVPIILAALDWKPSFYLMGLVIVVYSLGLVGVVITMMLHSQANFTVRALMSLFGLGMIVLNCYWLVLALRLRKDERDARDRRRFGK